MTRIHYPPPDLNMSAGENMSEKQLVWVAVLGGGGIVETAVVCATEEKAMEMITEHLKDSGYTAETWFKELAETHDYPDQDFNPTNLYSTEVIK